MKLEGKNNYLSTKLLRQKVFRRKYLKNNIALNVTFDDNIKDESIPLSSISIEY